MTVSELEAFDALLMGRIDTVRRCSILGGGLDARVCYAMRVLAQPTCLSVVLFVASFMASLLDQSLYKEVD